ILRQADRARGLDGALDVRLAHLAVLAGDGHDAAAVDAADVAAGDAGVDARDLDARHLLGLADGRPDRLHGRVDVDDDATAEAARGRAADADDVEADRPDRLADDGADLRGADVEADDEARRGARPASASGPGRRRGGPSCRCERRRTTGSSGTPACGARPRSRPSSSSQWRRLPWTSVKGRRSSTLITTRFGNSRTTSARRTSGSAVTRPATACVSRPRMLAPGAIEAAARICSTGRREAPRTSTLATASRGVVRSQRVPSAAPAASRTTSAATGRTLTTRRSRRRRRD